MTIFLEFVLAQFLVLQCADVSYYCNTYLECLKAEKFILNSDFMIILPMSQVKIE